MWFINLLLLKIKGIEISWTARVSPKSIVKLNGGSIKIGANSQINEFVILDGMNGKIIIGENVSINYGSLLYGASGLDIGDDVRIAAKSQFLPSNHSTLLSRLIREQDTYGIGIIIGNDVWIGAGSTILDGVVMQDKSVLGAHSLLSKSSNVGIGEIFAGSPAKLKSKRK